LGLADLARHVIKIFPTFDSRVTLVSCDEASNGQANIARHVSETHFEPSIIESIWHPISLGEQGQADTARHVIERHIHPWCLENKVGIL
jgi:hypothetical protein